MMDKFIKFDERKIKFADRCKQKDKIKFTQTTKRKERKVFKLKKR